MPHRLTVACCLWDANDRSLPGSRCYDESWVDKLYRGFRRNLSEPFRFVVFSDRQRVFRERVDVEILTRQPPDYGSLIEPFRLNEPTIVCGLDMIVLGRIDHMARYCMTGDRIALPAHPGKPHVTINPVVFVPKGHRRVFDDWRGENDMEWLKLQDHIKSDTMWPGQILSYKMHDVRRRGLGKARIVYFHGQPKPPMLDHQWVREHWR